MKKWMIILLMGVSQGAVGAQTVNTDADKPKIDPRSLLLDLYDKDKAKAREDGSKFDGVNEESNNADLPALRGNVAGAHRSSEVEREESRVQDEEFKRTAEDAKKAARKVNKGNRNLFWWVLAAGVTTVCMLLAHFWSDAPSAHA